LQLHDVIVEHWTGDRDPVRRAEQLKYYERREQYGTERGAPRFVEGLDGKPVRLRGQK